RIAKHPQSPRPFEQDRYPSVLTGHPSVLTRACRQRTMLARIVKRERLIVVCSSCRDIPRAHQGIAHEAMPDHERDCRSFLFRERHVLRRKLTHYIAVERDVVGDTDAGEDREQQHWILERLSQCFSLFDQQPCPLCSRLSFRSSVPFERHERG